MTSTSPERFITRALGSLRFSKSLMPDVLDTYAPRYTTALTRNESCREYYGELTTRALRRGDYLAVRGLLSRMERSVPEAIFSYEGPPDVIVNVLQSLNGYWTISDADNQQLVAKGIDKTLLAWDYNHPVDTSLACTVVRSILLRETVPAVLWKMTPYQAVKSVMSMESLSDLLADELGENISGWKVFLDLANTNSLVPLFELLDATKTHLRASCTT